MPDLMIALSLLIVTFISYVVLFLKLRFHTTDSPPGRYRILFGGVLVVTSAGWNCVRQLEIYGSWFVPSAYTSIDILQAAVLLLGALLTVLALISYQSYWTSQKDELSSRTDRLTILENLCDDARQPYQLVDLMNIALKEIILHIPDACGAVFMVNRARRQFILTGSTGLTRDETAHLEYYPLDRNIVSQALDQGSAMIGTRFGFVDREGKAVDSRFRSVLVLPMLAGMEKLGGIILMTEETKSFNSDDIKTLTPVASWLAEKVNSARLSRAASLVEQQNEKSTRERTELFSRLSGSVQAMKSSEPISEFCRCLMGLKGAESVHLCGIHHGGLHFYGGSEPYLDLSENFKTALLEAIDRRKSLILNQEALDESGQSRIVNSALVIPVKDDSAQTALLFRRQAPPFDISEKDLDILEVFTGLARTAISQAEVRRLDVTRKTGLQKIIQLLSADDSSETAPMNGVFFARHLGEILPEQSIGLYFSRRPDGYLAVEGSYNTEPPMSQGLVIAPGEGGIGRQASIQACEFVYGQQGVTDELRSFTPENENRLRRIFGEQGLPSFAATCPISVQNHVVGIVVFYAFDLGLQQRTEWERLLTLATELFSLRLTVDSLKSEKIGDELSGLAVRDLNSVANRLNNHLSAIMGSAELAAGREDVTGDLRLQLESIASETERTAGFVRKIFSKSEPLVSENKKPAALRTHLEEAIDEFLDSIRISENVCMVGGRPREVDCKLDRTKPVAISSGVIRALLDEALNRFGSLAEDDETISLATYQTDDNMYLDISRHPKNFPAVRRVAEFGEYQIATDVLGQRPTDSFLSHLRGSQARYSFDRDNTKPTYLSFRFTPQSVLRTSGTSRRRILAIDDEAIILDLISAMGQSMDYQVITAESGAAGLRLLDEGPFDLILVDLAMPGLSGLDVSRQLRDSGITAPIILITGWQANLEESELQAAGISDVLAKPFRIEQLANLVRQSSTSIQ